jgi:glycerol-3-phosphate acyltransferase PlsY
VLSLLVVILLWMFVSGFVGYLLGSFPAAYLLVKWKSNLDIRNAGSGNVGGLNSYLVTRSKFVGIVVVLLDVAKGMAAVLLVDFIVGEGFIYLAAAGVGAVLGHNFPVWLRFRGGRGIATAGGVLLILSWQLAVLWMVLWAVTFLITRQVNVGNAIASVLMVVAVLATPSHLLRECIPADAPGVHFKYFTVLLAGLILIKLIEPLQKYVKEKRGLKEKNGDLGDAGS